MIDPTDEAVVATQLGRPPRAIHDVGHRCPCGNPDVVTTEPRLPNGTPFPTTYYLTCPRAASLIGTLEGSGVMKQMEARLADDPGLADAYRSAHEAYLAARAELGEVPEIDGVSAGGMPDRVKCLHVLAGHALAAGPGVNPLGDEVLDRLGAWWAAGPCVESPPVGSPGLDSSAAASIAAIDCGTNTIKLLIADLPGVLVRESRMVRLGEGVDRTGRLGEAALERTFGAIDEYADLIAQHGATRIRFCATSATRDADNSAAFVEGVRSRLGVEPEVLSGAQEADLAYQGAVRHLVRPPEHPVLVVDVGGGSTELILGTDRPQTSDSMDIGSVRLHERHGLSDPPTDREIAACVADIDRALDATVVPVSTAATVVGVAGTVTTLAAAVLDLPAYDRAAIDQADLDVVLVHAQVERIVALTVEERLRLPFLHPGRADVIGVGALILSRVLRRTPATRLVVSESDILDGIAWSIGEPSGQ